GTSPIFTPACGRRCARSRRAGWPRARREPSTSTRTRRRPRRRSASVSGPCSSRKTPRRPAATAGSRWRSCARRSRHWRRSMTNLTIEEVAARSREIVDEVERAIVGKRGVLELALMAILADGHLLIEDVPGLAKTLLARSFASVADLDFKRIQFT